MIRRNFILAALGSGIGWLLGKPAVQTATASTVATVTPPIDDKYSLLGDYCFAVKSQLGDSVVSYIYPHALTTRAEAWAKARYASEQFTKAGWEVIIRWGRDQWNCPVDGQTEPARVPEGHPSFPFMSVPQPGYQELVKIKCGGQPGYTKHHLDAMCSVCCKKPATAAVYTYHIMQVKGVGLVSCDDCICQAIDEAKASLVE